VGSIYALVREGSELYHHRKQVDPLALAHPILIGSNLALVLFVPSLTGESGAVRKLMGYFKYHFIEKKQRDVIDKTRNKMSRLVSNALDGLADIQVGLLSPIHIIYSTKMPTRESVSCCCCCCCCWVNQQVNNLQQHQLHLLDKLISTELAHSLGLKTLVAHTWNLFSNRNALEFVAELYVVHQVGYFHITLWAIS